MKIYTADDVDNILDVLPIQYTPYTKKIRYINIIVTFDIETSNWELCNEKYACMYVWQMSIDNHIVMGRTWDDFFTVLDKLSSYFELNPEKTRLIIWVHNLSFEFGFIAHKIADSCGWFKIFALDSHKPVYAVAENGIEFRCSYILSGYSLDTLAKSLTKHKIRKLKGALDYRKLRHAETPLTKRELCYCINDVLILHYYISERAELDGGLHKILLTKTSYPRKFCKDLCLGAKYKRLNYKRLLKPLTMDEQLYTQLKRAFLGGFTHANPSHAMHIKYDVTSYDLCSSYPTVMVAKYFPMGAPQHVDGVYFGDVAIEKIHELQEHYCILFDVTFQNLESTAYDNYLSLSHCTVEGAREVNNGRIYQADFVKTTVTDVDFDIISNTYQWDDVAVENIVVFKMGYLPTDFVDGVLTLYEQKTQLKGLDDMAAFYQSYKEMLNSLYGMTVTDPVRDVWEFGNIWEVTRPDIQSELDKYNKSSSRFLYYAWGVWVTAYARANLWSAIIELGHDYIYSDTDSVKFLNYEKHKDYFLRYNENVVDELDKACRYHRFDENRTRPLNKKGAPKQLGVWDFDGHYQRFKTLGAKRYMVEYSARAENENNKNKISMTVSGINKHVAIPYLLDKYGKDKIFDMFDFGLYLPPEKSGKLIVQYHDEKVETRLTDYLGNTLDICENGYTYITPAEYEIKSSDYISFLEYYMNQFEDRRNDD